MNYVTNEHGKLVPAVGAPGSIARLIAEHPSTWPIRISREQLEEATSGNPTHLWPMEDEHGNKAQSEPVWEIGVAEPCSGLEDDKRWVYGIRPSWVNVFERYPQVLYSKLPLEPVRYKLT